MKTKPSTPLEVVRKAETEVIKELTKRRDTAYQRFPLLFTMLATFGIVATFYGFEHLIDNINFLANNPILLLGVGLCTLILTGQLYKKLG
ncbi:hypothetical protein E6P97_00260 [Patescibacteria group bacterium]|nr:MAG: hypothetical protein E6P97_00260 [Patescibacteria group bacterium]